MRGKICYLGDDHMSGAAVYLAGIMLHYGIPFDHVRSDEPPPDSFMAEHYALYVVSDYPAARFSEEAMRHIVRRVEEGAGLAMFGGWESYFGRLGEYHRSPLADALPVVMEQADDRRNQAQPCLVKKVAEHPILDGVPWDEPPGIGGFNAFTPKPGAETLLTSVRFAVSRVAGSDEQGPSGEFRFVRGEESPLLVVGQNGKGRTAALATDVAPHWVGGMVDWGDRRVVQDVAEGFIDVGNWYARFFANLLAWTGRSSA